MEGRNGAFLFGTGEGRSPPALALDEGVLKAISSLDQLNVLRVDPIHIAGRRPDAERLAFAHLHAPHMVARCFEFGWDDGPYPVPRPEASDLLVPHLVATRETVLVPVGPAMVASSGGLDRKRFELAPPDTRQFPDAQGIKCMGLLDSEACPVPPGPPTCPGADGQAKNAQGRDHLEPDRVDRRRVLEWACGLCLDFRMSIFSGSLVPLLLIAVVAS